MSLKDVIFKMSRHLIETCESSEELRLKQTAFTRKRRLGAQNLLRILLRRLVDSLRLGIDAYYDFLQEDPVSRQAFSRARANLNPEYVRKFADGIAEIHAQNSDAPTYAGMRLIAIDGTDIVPRSRRLSVVRDPRRMPRLLWTLSPTVPWIMPYMTVSWPPTPQMSAILPKRLTELGLTGSLLLLDRWYPSKAFIAQTLNMGVFLRYAGTRGVESGG